MVEIQVVRGRLKLLAEYLADLKEISGISWTDFSENKVLRRYVERTLHLAVEACLSSSESRRIPKPARPREFADRASYRLCGPHQAAGRPGNVRDTSG